MKRCENSKCWRWFEPTQPARSVQRFCCANCRAAWHYQQQRDVVDAAYAAEVREAEDRLNGTITLDLIPIREEEPPLVVKRRKILSVEASR